tara:strand:+ start:343 stop:486 length:144 start_codon:yes stop_codon:yes gene_type:complete
MKEIDIIENMIKQLQRDRKLQRIRMRKQKIELNMLLRLVRKMKEESE